MKLFRYVASGSGEVGVGIETDRGRFRLTEPATGEYGGDCSDFLATWLREEDPLGWVQTHAARASEPLESDVTFLAPVDCQEVWASGVTYERSKVARMEESEDGGDFYDKVYTADRPELFFKSTSARVVDPGDPVRVRRDSTWNVPEPEMTLVISSRGQIVGVTVGNDMSSRSIEGENPLYLPQAKTYDGACALGPAVRLLDDAVDLRNLTIRLQITRGGEVAYDESTSTARMRRTPDELVGYLFRETTFPDGVLLMTGTGLVPPDTFSLQSGDVVSITIDGVGTLTNPVA